MAYGALRFLHTNKITGQSMLTLSSQATGRVGGTRKDGSGVASLTVTGSFGAALDLLYTIEIDDVSGGAENGEATFKWRTSNTAAETWEEESVATRATPAYALSADGLSGGLSVAWTGGVGDDFAEEDEWQWWAKATYGAERLLDLDRHTFWKTTGDTSENVVINFGAGTKVTAAVLADHNLTSGATVKWQMNASDSWGSPSLDYTFSAITDPLIWYGDQTYQYGRWLIADASNPDTYIQVGHIGAYEYLQLNKTNAHRGSSETFGLQIQENESLSGLEQQYYHAARRLYTMQFGETLSDTDVDSLVTMRDALIDSDSHIISPLWVHWFYDDTDYLRLMRWGNIAQFQRGFFQYLLNSLVELQFEEVVKTT